MRKLVPSSYGSLADSILMMGKVGKLTTWKCRSCCRPNSFLLTAIMRIFFPLRQRKRKEQARRCPPSCEFHSKKLTSTPKTESLGFFCTVVSFMSLKLWSIAFLLPTICRCPACFCPAIIEYHRGSISTPSLSPSGLHDELWQLTDSLLSSSMNSFRVILCLLNAYCDQRWPGSGEVCAFMSRQAFVQTIIGEWTSTKVLQSHMADIMSLAFQISHTEKRAPIWRIWQHYMLHELNNGLFIALHDYCNIAKIVPALCAALFKSCFIILDHMCLILCRCLYMNVQNLQVTYKVLGSGSCYPSFIVKLEFFWFFKSTSAFTERCR